MKSSTIVWFVWLSSSCAFVAHHGDNITRKALVDNQLRGSLSTLNTTETIAQQDSHAGILLRTKRHKKMTSSGCTTTSVLSTVGTGVGFGAGGGAATGAGIGTLVFPGIGTAVGALIGLAIGGAAGGAAGGAMTTTTSNMFCAQEIEQLIINRDLGIIDDDDTGTLMKEIRKKNLNYQYEADFLGLLIKDRDQTSAKVVATSSSPYATDSSVEIKYIVARNLHNTSELLAVWNDHHNKFISELQRQIAEDVSHFSTQQLRTWKDDKNFQMRSLLHDLRQDMEIISNNNYIRKLYDRVLSLENDLVELKLIVERMQEKAECEKLTKRLDTVPSAADKFKKITAFVPKIIEFIPQSATAVPVVGYIFSGLSILNSAYCFVNDL